MVNGNLTKIVIGGSATMFLTVLGFMGNGIVENEQRNVSEHIEIRKEAVEAIGEVKNIVTDVRLEQREQGILLKGIAAKL